MRILQVLPHLSKGGAERVVVELSNALVEAGHEVTLLLAFPVDPVLNQKFLDNRIRVQFVSSNTGNRTLQYLKLPFWIARQWKILKNLRRNPLPFDLRFSIWISSLFLAQNHTNNESTIDCNLPCGWSWRFPYPKNY